MQSRRNYRNEFTSRYDNQCNVSTSFYRQILRCLFISLLVCSRRDVCAHAHIARTKLKQNNAPHHTPIPMITIQKPYHYNTPSTPDEKLWRLWRRRRQLDKQWVTIIRSISLRNDLSHCEQRHVRHIKIDTYLFT